MSRSSWSRGDSFAAEQAVEKVRWGVDADALKFAAEQAVEKSNDTRPAWIIEFAAEQAVEKNF